MRGVAAPLTVRTPMIVDAPTAAHWSDWQPHPSRDYTLGVEEEVMLLNPHDWSLAQQIDRVIGSLPPASRST